jgi:hypothetical protein
MADTRTQVAIAFKWFFIQPLSRNCHNRGFPKRFSRQPDTRVT